MQEVPEDFFVDIISENNFLVSSLTDLFANVREHEDMAPQLRQKAISFENHLTKKFGWDFSQEDEEYAPTVVELWVKLNQIYNVLKFCQLFSIWIRKSLPQIQVSC